MSSGMTTAEAVALKLIGSGNVPEGSRQDMEPIALKFLELGKADSYDATYSFYYRECPICSSMNTEGSGVGAVRDPKTGILSITSRCDHCGQRYSLLDIDRLRTVDSVRG